MLVFWFKTVSCSSLVLCEMILLPSVLTVIAWLWDRWSSSLGLQGLDEFCVQVVRVKPPLVSPERLKAQNPFRI